MLREALVGVQWWQSPTCPHVNNNKQKCPLERPDSMVKFPLRSPSRGQTRCPRVTINTVYPAFLCVPPHTAGALYIFSLQPIKPPESITEQQSCAQIFRGGRCSNLKK